MKKIMMMLVMVVLIVGGLNGFRLYAEEPEENDLIEKAYYEKDNQEQKEYLSIAPLGYTRGDSEGLRGFVDKHLEYADKNPKSPFADDAVFTAAHHLIRTNPEEAIGLFEKVTSDYPNAVRFSLQAFNLDLKSLLSKNEVNKIKEYREHINEYPNLTSDLALAGIAECYERLGQYDKMVSYYQKILKKYPDGQWIAQDNESKIFLYYPLEERPFQMSLFRMGKEYCRRGDESRALEYYKKLFKLYPLSIKNKYAYDELSRMYLEKNRKKEAIEMLKKGRTVLCEILKYFESQEGNDNSLPPDDNPFLGRELHLSMYELLVKQVEKEIVELEASKEDKGKNDK